MCSLLTPCGLLSVGLSLPGKFVGIDVQTRALQRSLCSSVFWPDVSFRIMHVPETLHACCWDFGSSRDEGLAKAKRRKSSEGVWGGGFEGDGAAVRLV